MFIIVAYWTLLVISIIQHYKGKKYVNSKSGYQSVAGNQDQDLLERDKQFEDFDVIPEEEKSSKKTKKNKKQKKRSNKKEVSQSEDSKESQSEDDDLLEENKSEDDESKNQKNEIQDTDYRRRC